MQIVDLFAGPGGWDVGARDLNLEPLGIEWDDAACATREAAGLRTLQADVAELDPADFPCDGLIASPPCQAFSLAGNGAGRAAVHHVMACVRDLAEGRDTRAEHNAACSDDRTMLVVEPLRWALALRPTWLAFEQVPPVMPLWRAFAEVLREAGYNVWTGVLEAERYGVPQTRERAILMAHRDRVVHPPDATHHRYDPRQARPEASEDLFGGGLLPWVSMAEALGWVDDGRRLRMPSGGDFGTTRGLEQPAQTVSVGKGPNDVVWLRTAQARPDDADGQHVRHEAEPAHTVTSKHRSAEWLVQTNNFTAVERDMDGKRSKRGSVPYERPVAAPAPTLDGSVAGWRVNTGRDWKAGGSREDAQQFDATTRPAPAVDGKGRWHVDRPATTTIAGDPRVHPPGHKINGDDVRAGREGLDRAESQAIRVSAREAAVLQSFPADYPWQGSKTAQFRQIGDAVPPSLARAVLEVLVRG